MELKLWNELNDQQAEKASGGEGIGQIVSGLDFKKRGSFVSALAHATNGPTAISPTPVPTPVDPTPVPTPPPSGGGIAVPSPVEPPAQ